MVIPLSSNSKSHAATINQYPEPRQSGACEKIKAWRPSLESVELSHMVCERDTRHCVCHTVHAVVEYGGKLPPLFGGLLVGLGWRIQQRHIPHVIARMPQQIFPAHRDLVADEFIAELEGLQPVATEGPAAQADHRAAQDFFQFLLQHLDVVDAMGVLDLFAEGQG